MNNNGLSLGNYWKNLNKIFSSQKAKVFEENLKCKHFGSFGVLVFVFMSHGTYEDLICLEQNGYCSRFDDFYIFRYDSN
jgi:hypothetical protein